MKNLAVINAVGLSPYAFLPISGGRSAFELALAFAVGLPDRDATIVFARAEDPDSAFSRVLSGVSGVKVARRSDWTTSVLFEELRKEAEGFDDVFYFWGDCPLLDGELARKMYDNHRKYYAEYSYADAYPAGVSPEILKAAVLPAVSELAAKAGQELSRDAVFRTVQIDINSFDIETEVSPVDVRLDRATLQCDSKKNFIICGRFIEAGARDSGGALELINGKPELLRTLPAFVNVQIEGGCPQACSYCPFPVFSGDVLKNRGEMPFGRFETLIDDVVRFCGEARIGLSLWGEPGLHSRVMEFAAAVFARPSLSLIIETSGIGWNDSAPEGIAAAAGDAGKERIDWIISLDALEEGLYQRLRGPGFAEARGFTERVMGLFPGRTYVQAVRMRESEEALEGFYRYWKERTDRVIIQKHDSFSGFLPDLKVTDLSPLKRKPCWHIMRDINVLIDGTVPMCREDLKRDAILGNVFEDSLETIWEKGSAIYREHTAGIYTGICAGCDEYYTYNF